MSTERLRQALARPSSAAYYAGLLVATLVGWLGFQATAPAAAGSGEFGAGLAWMAAWLWFLPLPYLTAWLVLMGPSVRESLAAAAVLALVQAALTPIGVAAGLLTMGSGGIVAFRLTGLLLGSPGSRSAPWSYQAT